MGRTTATVEYLNADGSPGGRLAKDKYDAARKELLKVIPRSKAGVAFSSLALHLEDTLPAALLPASGSGAWLATTVKLDLEGRGLIERVPGVTPQHVRRVK